MRLVLLLLFFCYAFCVKAQELTELEDAIRHSSAYNLKKTRSIAAEIFKIDKYNSIAINILAEAYLKAKQLDSFDAFFQRLKDEDPDNPMPYVMSARYQHWLTFPFDSSAIKELNKAVELDSNNAEIQEFIARAYYLMYLRKHRPYHAQQSRKHFLKTIQLSPDKKLELSYPVVQLSTLLNDTTQTSHGLQQLKTMALDTTINHWYFPFYYFLEIKDSWQTDTTVNIIHQVHYTTFTLEWYSSHLKSMNEPVLFADNSNNIYRFTWLRTFHAPIIIRVEERDNVYMLFWKQTNGAGGYGPGQLVDDESKRLTGNEWNTVMKYLEDLDFWNQPTIKRDGILGNDGSQWILEGVKEGNYHVIDRWTPEKNTYYELGKYLIELTGMKIRKRNFY